MRTLAAITLAAIFACAAQSDAAQSHPAASPALASHARPAPASHARPARMLVYAQEWSLWTSRARVPAGPVVVQLWNRGQDAHDLRVRRVDHRGRLAGAVQGGVAVTQSGALSQARWRLAPGRYELYCSLPGHLHNGMHTLLIVR